jgi:hypothetical protein
MGTKNRRNGKYTENSDRDPRLAGIGAGLVKTFLDGLYTVVANSRNITKSGALLASVRKRQGQK